MAGALTDPVPSIVVFGMDVVTTFPTPDGSDAAIWYPEALNGVLGGLFVITGETYTIYPVATTFDPAHEFRSDLPAGAVVGDPSTAFTLSTGGAEAEGEFTWATIYPSVTPLITSGITTDRVRAAVLVIDTGVAATDRLVAYFGRHSDGRQINQTPSGGAVSWSFTDGMLSI